MRSISLLLCCLALSIAPALTKYADYAKFYAGSSSLERVHFHSLLESVLEPVNETYKPKDTGKFNYQFIQILMEIVSKLPETENVTIPRYIHDFLRNTLGLRKHVLEHLKRALDYNYYNMMRKIERRADGYRRSLNDSSKNPQTQSMQVLANFYERLSKLKEERKGNTMEDSIQAVYHFFRGLPTLSELRQLICDKEEVFDFSRETFIRNFDRFLGYLQDVFFEILETHLGYQKHAFSFLRYFHDLLDEDILQELYFMHGDTRTIEDLMQLSMAVILRPKAYFVTVDDFKPYGMERFFAMSEKIVKGLNISQVSFKLTDAMVPHIVSMIKNPDMRGKACIMGMNSVSTIFNSSQRNGFKEAARKFCESQKYLQHIFVEHARHFGGFIRVLRQSGLPADVASLATNILKPGRLYPDSRQYPIEFHPKLKNMKDALFNKLAQIPKSMPKSFIERMRKFVKIITGSPACDKSQ